MNEHRKRKKKNRSGKNLIISIIAAAAVWIGVVYIVNPDISVTITPSKIRITGEQQLRDRGMVWSDKNKLPEFPLKISGKRSDLIDAMDKVKIELDVSGLSNEGNGYITPKVSVPHNVSLVKQSFGDIPVSVEKLEYKDIPVKIKQSGVLRDQLIRSESLTNQIRIGGAKKQVDSISSCIITIDSSAVKDDEEKEYAYMFTDSENNLVSIYDTIEADVSKILVKNTVYQKATVPVTITNDSELMKNFMINIKSVSPENIEIGIKGSAAPQEITAVFKNGDYKDGAGEYTLTAEEPENCYIPHPEIKIRAELSKKLRRQTEVTIHPENLGEGLNAVGMPVKLNTEVIAPKDQLENVTARADLSGLGAGTHEVSVTFDNNNITPVNPIRINVIIEG